jgi:hypothetical protein
MLLGPFVLRLVDRSVAEIQVAGGAVVAALGWSFERSPSRGRRRISGFHHGDGSCVLSTQLAADHRSGHDGRRGRDQREAHELDRDPLHRFP